MYQYIEGYWIVRAHERNYRELSLQNLKFSKIVCVKIHHRQMSTTYMFGSGLMILMGIMYICTVHTCKRRREKYFGTSFYITDIVTRYFKTYLLKIKKYVIQIEFRPVTELLVWCRIRLLSMPNQEFVCSMQQSMV